MPRQSPRTAAARRAANSAASEKAAEKAKSRPSQVIASRRAALANMNERLLEKFHELEDMTNTMQSDNIRYYYNLGCVYRDVEQHPEDYIGKDGTPGFELVQAASSHARLLRRCSQAARQLTEHHVDQLIGLANKEANFRLHWQHITYLLTIDQWGTLYEWAKKAVANLWDPKTLHDFLKKAGVGNRGHAHGRKHEIPATVPAQVRQMLKYSKTWISKQESVWHGDDNSIFANVLKLHRDDVDEQLADDLRELSKLMDAMRDHAVSNMQACAQALEHTEARLAQQRDEAVGAAAPNRPGRHRQIDLVS